MEKKIRIAMIGAGCRSNLVQKLLDAAKENVEIVAIYDPDMAVAETRKKALPAPNAELVKDYQSAINFPGVDWVMVFSPNSMHREHVLAAFAAGKHVFSEKPLATSIEDCKSIYDAWKACGRTFATGFVLRYSPLYRKAKEILDSGKLGKILAISADENIAPSHGGYIMCNWRRHTKFAGPHILEKCCHDLDLLNWLIGSLPKRVAAFGERLFFKPENQPLLEKYGKKTFMSWEDPHKTETPFTDDTDLMDTQVAIADYRNGVKVNFLATMSNALWERRMYFTCSEGSMILDLYTMDLRYKAIGEAETHVYSFGVLDGHGAGDQVIMAELWECMRDGSAPKCGGSEGLESAVFAMALDRAMVQGTVIDLEPVWKSLER